MEALPYIGIGLLIFALIVIGLAIWPTQPDDGNAEDDREQRETLRGTTGWGGLVARKEKE